MEQEKRLLQNTVIYAIGNFGSKVLSFLLVPLFSFYLTKAEFGYYDIVVITATITVPLVTFQISDGVYRWLLDIEQTVEEFQVRKIISSSSVIIIINISIALTIFFLLKIFFFKETEHIFLLLNYFVSLCLLPYFQQIVRGQKKNKLYATVGILNSFVLVLSNVVLLAIFNLGVKALLLSMAFANYVAIFLIIFKVRFFKYFSFFNFNKKLALKLVGYSFPLIPNIIGWWMISSANRYIILKYLGEDANGVFAMAVRITAILVMINSIFSLAWQESAITEYNSNNRNSFYTRIFRYYFRIELVAVIILLPITKLAITYFVDEAFQEAWIYTPFLYAGVAFSAFSAFLGTGYLSSKNTMGAFYTTIFGAITNLIISFSLIQFLGLLGAAVGSMAGFLLTWRLRAFQTKKYFSVQFDRKDFVCLFSLLIISSLAISHVDGAVNLLLLMTLLLCVCSIIYWRDVKYISNFVKQKITKR